MRHESDAMRRGRTVSKALIFALALAFVAPFVAGVHARGARDKIKFWDAQRKGANYHNSAPAREWWAAAKEAGIEVVRLFPNNWATRRRDFLIGDADRYERLDEEDFRTLTRALDDAHAHRIGVVITTVSLPGSRWRQQNNEKDDLRVWREARYHEEAARFWHDLAARLKNHPAVVGYNILNEPHPERATRFDDFWTEDFAKWYAGVENTPADLNLFYAKVVASIRRADRETPVVLDSGLYATPWAFKYLKPLRDERIIYSFHMAEPWAYTTRRINRGRFAYPGVVTIGDGERKVDERAWDAGELERFLAPVAEWQRRHKIPARRIFVGEFGCGRTVAGADKYLADLTDIFDRRGWHWAFYQFRSDGTWTERDYEFGVRPPGAGYWDAAGRGERPQGTLARGPNPVWDVLRKALARRGPPLS
ncbi:MAG TPA: cellulase family glycosylhydrolase [Pyrinomonadaceae bacterium]|nr:cellulase family glycosylhydrolase [Pyrinomonadaceae bacterium]